MNTLWLDIKEMLREQFEYRELLYRFTTRDIMLRYKQTVMGFAWAIFMPIINTIVFSVIFTRVAPIQTPVPYPLFAYCGLSAWNLFASSVRFSASSLSGNPGLVSKVYFPREIFPFSAILVSLVDFGVATILMAAMMVYYGVMPTAAILLLPVVVLVHLTFTAAVGLIVAVANLYYRDVKYLLELVLTVWMFVSAVLYPTQLMGGTIAAVVRFNPMTPIIDGYRTTLLGVPMADPLAFAVTAVLSALLLLWSWVMFHRSEFTFAENI
ncbi:MAG: ABC transporter permease [Acidobacteria bacterium]|nr:ABC transporter permease [Acidobacteriota bacterium]